MNVGMLSCYDQALEIVALHVTKDPDVKKPSLSSRLLASGVAGFTAAFFSLPFDMIKSRLQNGTSKYSGVIGCASSILQKEGVLAFWTGFSAYYGRCAPHAMIILMTSDSISKFYKELTKGL